MFSVCLRAPGGTGRSARGRKREDTTTQWGTNEGKDEEDISRPSFDQWTKRQKVKGSPRWREKVSKVFIYV